MTVLTPQVPAASAPAVPSSHTSFPPAPIAKPTFNRPVAPEPNPERDNELINYYFDGMWTTKDIAEHFKVPIPVVIAWLQRSDIAAVIDFVAAANERRARDIARENLPGTIDILLRISRGRKDDNVSRAASSAIIRFSRGPSSTSLTRKSKNPRPADGTCDFSTVARARRAGESPPRGMQDSSDTYSTHQPPGRDAEAACPAQSEPISSASHTHAAIASAESPPPDGSGKETSLAASSTTQSPSVQVDSDVRLPVLQTLDGPVIDMTAAIGVSTPARNCRECECTHQPQRRSA